MDERAELEAELTNLHATMAAQLAATGEVTPLAAAAWVLLVDALADARKAEAEAFRRHAWDATQARYKPKPPAQD